MAGKTGFMDGGSKKETKDQSGSCKLVIVTDTLNTYVQRVLVSVSVISRSAKYPTMWGNTGELVLTSRQRSHVLKINTPLKND
ncbi:hypothetical protein GBAR_LOCUS23626 [Geodia barretti]|uniref:Uncharacterized protein n=1 Tax=Geodia barretti TaxID=519541 RepID=A0AA35T8A8_GEOBA|nr:hypothetical protein GBAR_LOCUS23626 [Geodia barretti]